MCAGSSLEAIKPHMTARQFAQLEAKLRLIPDRHREDAIQEACVACLEGKDPARAANKYAMTELRHEVRFSPDLQRNTT